MLVRLVPTRTRYRRDGSAPLYVLAVVLGICIGLSACGPDAPPASRNTTAPSGPLVADSMTIPRMLATDDRFSTLRAALDSTRLDSVLATDGPLTLFAPPDEAFAALPPGTMETLMADDRERLRALLARHIVRGRLAVSDRASPRSVVTMRGDTLSLRPARSDSTIENASFLDRNIEAANGLLHVVDTVLRPPDPGRP